MSFTAITQRTYDPKQLKKLAREYFSKLSRREKIIILVAAAMGLFTVVYSVFEPVNAAFEDQNARLEKTVQEMDRVALALGRYAKVKSKRDEIEKTNREVEFSEGVLTYIEELLKTKAGVVSNPQINPRDPKPFGDQYEQVPVSIRFPIVDVKRLGEFLTATVHGEKPLILTSLDIRKRPAGDSLDVELEVSSLRKVSK